MAGEDFFKFNKGNEFRFSNFREIKEEDLKGADEKTKKLFNIFAGEDKILQEVEAKSLFNVLKTAAGDNQVLEDNEIKAFAKEHIGEEVDTNILATFVNNIFGTKEKTQNQSIQNVLANAPQKQQTFLEEAACKEIVIDIIDENLSEAYEILNSQYLGSISGWHDERKDKNDILKTSNVSKVLDYQNAGIEWMNKAKLVPPNGLTKKEYYEGNKQRIKDMILTRVLVLDTNTKFKELKNKYSEEKLAQIIGDYVEQLCSNASIEDLKDIQKQFVSYSGVEEIQALENVIDNAIKFNADKNKPMPYSEVPLPKFDNSKGIVPEYWNSDEPISFEEVYKIERGTEYSQYKIEQYALAKKEMEVIANAYNKKQQFIEFAEGLRKDETLSIDEKTQKVLEGFATFYALAEDGGLSQLQELIAESKLPISIDENGFNFGTLDDSAKNRALNSLLKLAQQSKEKEFEAFLNGKTIEDYQIALAQAHDEAIGDENGKMMAEAMKNDNLTCIQRWTGSTSMLGMGMTVVGGILCFTPLAPFGAGMITVGNTLAIGGMVAKTGLGVTDYATKEVQTQEELVNLGKDFIMDAGGFIIGMKAGQAGMKAFSKLIDKKLVVVFGQQIASGNKMQALKTVFSNPEYLKSFMTAAGAKLSADFVISYAGDLAMMGILDTQDDWQSLLKANLTGILVGMSGDIKDVSGVGRLRNFGISDGVKPMTEMDYGQRLLGNDVTVADPKTGATVEGTVTGLYSQDGQVEIEVNGQRYSTNDVEEVKGEAKVEKYLSQKNIDKNTRIENTLEQRMSIDLEPDSPAYILYSCLEKAENMDVFEGIKSNIDLITDKAQKDLLYKKYLFEIQRISSEETKVFLNKVLTNETLLDNPLIYQICEEILKKPQKPDYIPIPTLIDKLHLTGPYMQYEEKSYCESKLKSNQYLLKVADFFVSNPKLYENPAIENQIKKVINFPYSEKIANDIIAGMELYLKNNKWQENNIVIDNIEILFKRFKTVEEKEGLINYFIKCFSAEEYVPETKNNLSAKQILLDKIGHKINTNPKLKNSNIIKDMLTDIYFNSNKELEIELLNKFFDTDLITKDLFYEFKNFCRTLKSSDKSTVDAISNFIDFYKKNPKLFENCEDRELYLTLIRINDKNIDLIKTLYSRNDIDNNSIYSLINNLTDDNMGLIFDLYSTNELSLVEIDYIAFATNSNSKIDAKIKVDFCKYLQKHKDIPVSDWFHLISKAAPVKGNEYKTALLYKLIENKDFPNELLSSVMCSINKDNIGLIEKICLDSSFPKDKLIRTIANLHDEIRIKLAEKLYKDKRISNEYISNLLGFNVDNAVAYEKIIFDDKISIDILANLDSNARYNISEKNLDSVQDLLRNYKKYGIYEEQLNCIINSNFNINLEKFGNLNKLLDKETLLKLNDTEILICADNLNLIGKKSISDLSKTEKRNLFNVLLANKAAIEEGKIDNLQELIPILPQNTDEYVQIINRFKSSFQVDESNTLSLNSKILLENSLRDLDNSLATTNVINDIKLEYSHKDFVEKINFILKDLSPEKQKEIQDMFGFKIIDGKLTGYPDANMHLENFLNPDLVIKIQKEIEKFTNNHVIVENNPQLSNTLNSLIKYCPKILNQIDNSNDFKKVLQQLQITLSKEDFKQLSINDKKIVIFAHLLGNTDKHLNTRVDSACESFLISQELGFTKEESLKLYSIIEMLNAPEVFMTTSKKATIRNYRNMTIEGQERQDVFDLLAFKMKEGNLFNLTTLVYDSKYPENFTSRFNNLLKERIQEIKANDFSLPQTAASTYKKLATETQVVNNNKIYKVNVVKAEKIPDFYAIAHTPEAGFATGGSRNANFANFKLFEMLGDDKIICTSYITADKAVLVKEFHNGFIFEVPNDKQYVGYGTDIFSLGKNIPDMVVEYFRDRGLKANNSRGEKWNHRTFISESLKRELYGIIGSKFRDVDSKYIERLDYIKAKLGNKPLTIENLREIDPEFANAYERVLKSKGMNIFFKKLLNSATHNEVLVSNPKISAIFTDNIDKLPEEYLIKAQEENLPIVIINN